MVTALTPSYRKCSPAGHCHERNLFRSLSPLGYGGGDGKLYRYVGNRPTNATDPGGLVEVDGYELGPDLEDALPWAQDLAQYIAMQKQAARLYPKWAKPETYVPGQWLPSAPDAEWTKNDMDWAVFTAAWSNKLFRDLATPPRMPPTELEEPGKAEEPPKDNRPSTRWRQAWKSREDREKGIPPHGYPEAYRCEQAPTMDINGIISYPEKMPSWARSEKKSGLTMILRAAQTVRMEAFKKAWQGVKKDLPKFPNDNAQQMKQREQVAWDDTKVQADMMSQALTAEVDFLNHVQAKMNEKAPARR